jgi:hypothetical protein
MTRISMETLISMIGGDRELVTILVREQIITAGDAGFAIRDVDRVLVARTLIRELEIDAGAVSMILRLREQLAEARRELARLRAAMGED